MATRTGDGPGLGEAARHVAEHASAIARLELQLAVREVRRKATRLVGAVVLLAGAGFLAVVGLLLGVGAGVAAISIVLPVWAALLIVMGGLALVATPLALVALVLLKHGTPPIPEQAIQEAKLTTEALKNGRRH
jgi:hypothetical protein